MDNQFYSTLDAMKAELEANHYPTQSIGGYQSDYESAKSGMRSKRLAKVRR